MLKLKQPDMEKKPKPDQKQGRGPTVEFYRDGLYERVAEDAKKSGTSVRNHVNETFELVLEREEALKKYIPQLTKINFLNGIFYINDSEANQMAEVGLDKKSKIHCKLCKSTECVHVVFVMCQIEMPRIEPMK